MHTVYIIILSFVTRTGCLERVLEQRDTNFLTGSWLATLSGERQFRSCHVVWNVPVHEQKIRASTFFCGAASGMSCWALSFPIDQYKTRFQIERVTTYKESANAMRQMISADVGTFWKPFPVIMLRNFIVAGTSMTAVEYLRNFFP